MEANPPGPQTAVRQRMNYACEACRAAKLKCQPSKQQGTCQRCLDSKRECVIKTGPRPRRPRRPKQAVQAAPEPLSPPPGPSGTFTIDISMPADEADEDPIAGLRARHSMYVDIMDDESPSDADELDLDLSAGQSSTSRSSLPLGASALSTPPSSVAGGTSTSSSAATASSTPATMGVRPRFNLESAATLLSSFRDDMMPYFPCILLGEDESIETMARHRPFVLLAVLAAASGSRTLRGHGLYDEEFRKVLGLKFVSSDERSLELLLGLIVYCAWYPFHLRPKNKQVFRYVRMIIDLVHDLELDQDVEAKLTVQERQTEKTLDEIRAYLASYYVVSNYAIVWRRNTALQFTKETSRCCDILERDSTLEGDHVLAWLVRIQHILDELNNLRKLEKTGAQPNDHTMLMLKGMETQLNEWDVRLHARVSSSASIRFALLSARICLLGAPLLLFHLPGVRARSSEPTTTVSPVLNPDPVRLAKLIQPVRDFLDLTLSLSPTKLRAFSAVEWARLILCVIVAFRLSFPLPNCPEWNSNAARPRIALDAFLERFCAGRAGNGSAKENANVLAATKIVLGVVKERFDRRVLKAQRLAARQQLEETKQADAEMEEHWLVDRTDLETSQLNGATFPLDEATQGCPMMDGSLKDYFPYWDTSLTVHPSALSSERAYLDGSQSTNYPELWATMTTTWAEPGVDLDSSFGDVNS